ncbi:MAG: tetratricopeptide repeat protein [Chitinispirillaceae bacterium]|jgi:tetratricopeptide (TPR) repeat protein
MTKLNTNAEDRAKCFLQVSQRDWIFGLILFVITLSAYQPVWNGTPIWDDELNMTSPGLRSLGGLAQIWTRFGATQQYYPLVHSVWWAAYHVWGDSPSGYHLLNILLHVLSALLLVRILRKLGVRGAWLAGGIFALHPVMVESVAWITELKNTLSGIFFLGAALAYLTFTDGRKRQWYVLSSGLFILGLLSKTAIAPFPLAMLAVVWWKRGRLSWRRDIVPLLPFVMAGILSGLVTFHVERTFVGAEGRLFSFSFIERCLIAGRVIWFYLSKVFWPVNLVFIYPRWAVNAGVWWQYLFPIAALLGGGLLWAVRGRWRSPPAVFFYFTMMLLPVIGFFNVYAFLFSFVADHWLYYAAIGPIAMSAGLIDRALGSVKGERRFLKPVTIGVLLTVLGLLTWKQSGMYADAETLYRTTIRKNPACWMAYNNLGLIMNRIGRTDEAVAFYRKALEINPLSAESCYNLGTLLAKTGQVDEATLYCRKAIAINPNHVEAYNNLGNILMQTGQMNEAVGCYRKALEINPLSAESYYNLGTLLAKTGQVDEATLYCRKAIAINPDYLEAYNNLGNILMQTGQMNEAVGCYRKALEINPGNVEACINLGNIAWQNGRRDEAVARYRKAVEINPRCAECYNNLGNVAVETGRTEEAMACYQKALEISPGYVEAHINMGGILLENGQIDKAEAHYRKALEIKPDDVIILNNLSDAFQRIGRPGDAMPFIRKALARATAAGQEAQARTIAEILERLHKAGRSPP